MVQRSIVNLSDIEEDFLLEDTGIRIIIQRINNSTLEECPVYHTLEPRRKSLEVSSNPQFIDSVSTSTNMANLFVKVHNLLHEICDLCSKTFTKRGITKHRNSCLKKQQTIQLIIIKNKLLFNCFFLIVYSRYGLSIFL